MCYLYLTHCGNWVPLDEPDRDGKRKVPLQADPLLLHNDDIAKYICSRCWDLARYDTYKRKVVDGKIRAYVPDPEPPNRNICSNSNSNNTITKQEQEQQKEPEYQKTDFRSTSCYTMYM